MLFLEQLINGICTGSIYALFAVGFGIVFSTMQILNLAQGVYATYGAMITYFAIDDAGLPYWLAVIAGVLAAGLVAVFVDQIAFEPLRRRGVQLLGAVIASIGMWIALREVLSIATHATPVGFPPSSVPRGRIEIGSIDILSSQLLAVILAAVVIAGVYHLLHRTNIGAAIRAVGYDKRSAQIAGINPRTMIIGAALLSGAVTGLAGILLAGGQSFNFNLGDGLLLQGFAAVVIGGMGDVRGAALGGLLIGVVQTLSASYISAGYQDAITFGLVLVVLLARPTGLLGTANFQRA
ncbi:branched-chain amino acid ABC transporter permease [Nocardia aurantia]|uniref:High-affinity branched-chain amino acid transport system permease protein LivH n=1 Tax=Nocardia aurantia TaxID=2585199 RepID=A0A7K0DXA6_9NOCA|nr:branched-chain amino acid ABC transporter permease [Nocardia aurantia]MQY30409.1 High-affinity branched-chain amino acid transport system permease protein LivH [Nocardia aurantia]